VFDARIGDISGRGKLAADMREIWLMQTRFERRQGNSVATLIEQPRFRAGFDFLRLRGDAGEIDAELANWWEDFSQADEAGRRALLDAARAQGQSAPRRVRSSTPRVASATDTADVPEPEVDEAAVSSEGDAPRKRRRRRRKPAAAEGGESAASVDVNPSNPSRDF